MSFTQEVLLTCVVTPAIIAGVFALASSWLSLRHAVGDEESPPATLPTSGIAFVIGWCLAVCATLAVRQWLASDDQAPYQTLIDAVVTGEGWTLVVWPMTGYGIVMAALPQVRRFNELAWVLASLLAIWSVYVAIPSGDGWDDLMPVFPFWMAAMATSILLNAWSIKRINDSGGEAWCLLVVLAGLGIAIGLGGLSYAAPAEWAVSGWSATAACLVIGWFCLFRNSYPAPLNAIAYPGCVMIATLVGTARVYTWEDYPAWIYGVGLFLPTLIGFADWPLSGRSWKVRMPAAATLTIMMIAACLWKLVLSEPEQNW